MGLKERIIAECEWAIAQIDNGSISVPETRSFFGCVRRLLENEPVSPVVAFTRQDGTKAYSCPRCAALLRGGSYCSHCGQALEWCDTFVKDTDVPDK